MKISTKRIKSDSEISAPRNFDRLSFIDGRSSGRYTDAMKIPLFPEFVPIDLDLRPELHPFLSMTPDGVSEYTFSNLYLFRKHYDYRISRIREKAFVISGRRDGKSFFMTPCTAPGRSVLLELFETHDFWKGISDSVLHGCRACLECRGIEIVEDRNNFDYLYLRSNLAELPGKKYHKKRNLVNAFKNTYSSQELPLDKTLVPEALAVLEQWKTEKGSNGDYDAAREALELFEVLEMRGALYRIDDRPVAWCLGECLARGRMFAVHFEKGLDRYKGLYQFVNQSFAASLPECFKYVNREQDLGDEGLRQAKMTYRPSGFVRKYTATFARRS